MKLSTEACDVPRCSSCSPWSPDFRCHCRGTGHWVECYACGEDMRGNALCILVSGDGVQSYVCPTKECIGSEHERAHVLAERRVA